MKEGDYEALDSSHKGTQKFLEVLKKEVENVKNQTACKEDYEENKLQLLEQISKEASGLMGLSRSGDIHSPLSPSSLDLHAGLYNQNNVLSPISQNTVETQTGFLPSPAWSILQTGLAVGDMTSISKAASQMSPTVFGTTPFAALSPDSLATQQQPYESPTNFQQGEGASGAYLSPTATTTPSSAVSPSSVPVQERRKMVPTKKGLVDKKKTQLLQQQNNKSNSASQLQTKHIEQKGQSQMTTKTEQKGQSQMTTKTNLNPNDQKEMQIKSGKTIAVKTGNESEGSKKDKKRSISSQRDCDCGYHVNDQSCCQHVCQKHETRKDFPELSSTSESLTTSLQHTHGSAGVAPSATTNLEFVPTSGIGPSQQVHLTPLQVAGSGGVPIQYGSSQHHQQKEQTSATITSACGSIGSPSTATPAVTSVKSQGKQSVILQSPPSGVAGQRGTGLATPNLSVTTSNTIHSAQQLQQQSTRLQHQTSGSVNKSTVLASTAGVGLDSQNVSKKNKKSAAGKEIQQLTTDLEQHVNNKIGDLNLQNIHEDVMYQNISPYPVSTLPLTSDSSTPFAASNLQGPSDIMVVNPATPAKILNDQIPEAITQNTQVSYILIGFFYLLYFSKMVK